MAVTETIQELLQGILDSQYGRDMRQFIHDAIKKCYEEGSAGETDLEARERLDAIEEQIGDLTAWYSVGGKVNPYNITGVLTPYSDVYVLVNPSLCLAYVRVTIGISQNIEERSVLFGELPVPQSEIYSPVLKDSSLAVQCGMKTFSTDTRSSGYADGAIMCGSLPVETGSGRGYYSGSVIYRYLMLDRDHPITS